MDRLLLRQSAKAPGRSSWILIRADRQLCWILPRQPGVATMNVEVEEEIT